MIFEQTVWASVHTQGPCLHDVERPFCYAANAADFGDTYYLKQVDSESIPSKIFAYTDLLFPLHVNARFLMTRIFTFFGVRVYTTTPSIVCIPITHM